MFSFRSTLSSWLIICNHPIISLQRTSVLFAQLKVNLGFPIVSPAGLAAISSKASSYLAVHIKMLVTMWRVCLKPGIWARLLSGRLVTTLGHKPPIWTFCFIFSLEWLLVAVILVGRKDCQLLPSNWWVDCIPIDRIWTPTQPSFAAHHFWVSHWGSFPALAP